VSFSPKENDLHRFLSKPATVLSSSAVKWTPRFRKPNPAAATHPAPTS